MKSVEEEGSFRVPNEPDRESPMRRPVIPPGIRAETKVANERQALVQLEYAFILAARRQSATVSAALKSAGLTRTWAQALRLLNEHPGPITCSRIARVAGIDAASVTRLVDRLEGKGLVARVVVADDRRRQHIELTATGAAAAKEATKIYESALLASFAAIGRSDRSILGRLLSLVR